MAIQFHTPNPTADLVDDYLVLKAEQAELARRERAIKDALLETGRLQHEGTLGHVTIARTNGRKSYDRKELEALVPAKVLELCAKWSVPGWSFRVTARQQKAVA